MHSKLIVSITVMTLLTFLLTLLPKITARKQPISQTGNISTIETMAPIHTAPSPIPTVLANRVKPTTAVLPEIGRSTAGQDKLSLALDSFVQRVVDGNANDVVGVYVQGILASPIEQQPSDNPNFVSSEPETITQFGPASQYRTIGLLAHNYLVGENFADLKMSQLVIVVFGTGALKYYKITAIERYQALTPLSPQSDFIDLNNGKNSLLSASDVFNHIYTRGDRVVFQTCILANGDPSWGRLFVTATPLDNSPTTYINPLRTRVLTVF